MRLWDEIEDYHWRQRPRTWATRPFFVRLGRAAWFFRYWPKAKAYRKRDGRGGDAERWDRVFWHVWWRRARSDGGDRG